LASCYIRPQFYPNVPPQVLDPEWRTPAIVRYASKLEVEILCLQEVEPEVFAALEAGLGPLGYSGTFAQKGAGKSDGCATFLRNDCCELLHERLLVFEDSVDGAPVSGHIAQVLGLRASGMPMALVNTHLKWDPPHAAPERQIGLRQARLALAALWEEDSSKIQVICGDFNATPDSQLVDCLLAAGFDYSHRSTSEVFTCNSNRVPKLIDYVFFRGPARAQPEPVPPIDGSTVLPSVAEPSDHLPLIARITVLPVS
jgi:mRNA deadenylase 3'-5' endonuclease subunit Ccr4